MKRGEIVKVLGMNAIIEEVYDSFVSALVTNKGVNEFWLVDKDEVKETGRNGAALLCAIYRKNFLS